MIWINVVCHQGGTIEVGSLAAPIRMGHLLRVGPLILGRMAMMTNDTPHMAKDVTSTPALVDRALDEFSFTAEPEAEEAHRDSQTRTARRIGRASVCTAIVLLRRLANWRRAKLDRVRPLMPATGCITAAGFRFSP
jgi:glutamine synthetase adenylyltransferase